MYTFLTDEWMEAARGLREQYADRLPDVDIEVRINQIVTDVPFGDGTVHAYIDSSDGSLELELAVSFLLLLELQRHPEVRHLDAHAGNARATSSTASRSVESAERSEKAPMEVAD